MKKNSTVIKSFVAAAFFVIICHCELSADTVALGYFKNRSENRGLDYLQQVLPNSFASALKNKHDVETIKPGKITFLNRESGEYANREIKEKELPSISPYIGADYFVYGSYEPLPGNRIRLNVKIYRTYTTRIFSFTDEGKLETEIFRLVDRISYQIKNIASKSMLYKSEAIAKKSKLSIITNIGGEDLNILYYSFLKNGYRLSSVQGNELYTYIDENMINALSTMSASNAYYNIISDRSAIDLPHGTWSGSKYYRDLLKQRDVYNKYAFNFEKTFEEFAKKISSFHEDSFDYFVVIGFDKDQRNAWIRCISLKHNRLIVTESEITGGSIEEISDRIINTLSTGLPAKF